MTARRILIFFAGVVLAGCSAPRWPLQSPLTSPFGVRWRSRLPEVHRGVDFEAAVGTPVLAAQDGVVRFSGTMRGFGEVVWIDHGADLLTIYAHLSERRAPAGASVARGDTIGLSGQSGDVSGPHLHFEVWRWGRPVDPVPLMGGRPGGRPDVSPRP